MADKIAVLVLLFCKINVVFSWSKENIWKKRAKIFVLMVSWQSYHKYTEQLFSARQSFAQVNSAVDIRHDPKYVSTLNIQMGLF